ncbi:hypothetical protein EAI_05960, partial [Harpegnathos saltator]
AISISADKGKYKEILTEAKKKINIDELGISKIRTRQGDTGALILEIAGEDRNAQADGLAKKLSEILTDKANVTRPQKMGEIRIRGLEVSTSEEEAAQRVAQVGGCRVAEVQTGVIRTTPSGYRSLWMRCPLAAAKKVAEKGTMSLGWTQVKAELLETRPLQCYRCLERGHVQQNCSNNVDRRNICYRCGETDHLARNC